jgi:hypothetical protein
MMDYDSVIERLTMILNADIRKPLTVPAKQQPLKNLVQLVAAFFEAWRLYHQKSRAVKTWYSCYPTLWAYTYCSLHLTADFNFSCLLPTF